MSKNVTVATRGSALAVGQAEPMVKFLEARGYEVTWRKFSTSGDQWLLGPLDKQQGVVSTGRLLLIKDNQVGGPACGQAEGAATCKVCRTPY